MGRKKKRQRPVHVRFTSRWIETVPVTDERQVFHDDAQPDLGVRISPGGKKTWFWNRQVAGRPVFKLLGSSPSTSLPEARSRAQQLSGQLEALKFSNYNPTVPNPFKVGTRDELSLEQALDEYISIQLSHAKNPKRAEQNARQFASYFHAWHGRKLSQVSKADVVELHREIGKQHPVCANRVIALIRTIYNFAVDQERYSGMNPARKIRRFREQAQAGDGP